MERDWVLKRGAHKKASEVNEYLSKHRLKTIENKFKGGEKRLVVYGEAALAAGTRANIRSFLLPFASLIRSGPNSFNTND